MSELQPTDLLTAAERRELIASMGPEDAEGVPELHEVEIPDDLRVELEEIVGRYPQVRSASIPCLFAIQRRYGWCTPQGIREAAAVMGVSSGYLQSVASFYDLLRTVDTGEHRVLVCTNISCWMNGADELLADFCAAAGVDPTDAGHGGATSADGRVFLSGFECLGACDIAPMASIDDRYYGPLDADDAAAAIEALRSGGEVLPEKAIALRAAAGGPEPEPDPRIAENESSGDGADESGQGERTGEADAPPEDMDEAAGSEIRHPVSEQDEESPPEDAE